MNVDWSQAPKGARWWAVDEDGTAHWFGTPDVVAFTNFWFAGPKPAPMFGFKGDWRKSLFCACLGASSLRAQHSADREPPGPSSRKTGLVITEIMYNPRPIPGVANTNITHEFIEIFNSKPWAEDLGGFFIDGSVRFTFPTGTVLNAGAYLVLARVPGMIQTNYGITNIVGPWVGATTNRLPADTGQIRLRNPLGAVLLEVNYSDSPPWPETADGTGHSLALMRPSWGEDNYQAWSQSDVVGGSPGGPEPSAPESIASIFINEFQNHSDPLDWIEIYNHSNDPVDLSGAWLSDDPRTNKFRIPNGTVIAPRGFLSWDQNQLGFELFAGGETILLWNGCHAQRAGAGESHPLPAAQQGAENLRMLYWPQV